MANYFVRYSCCLHNDPKVYVIAVPWSETRICPRAAEVWSSIRTNSKLLKSLFGDDLSCYNYEDMAQRPEHYDGLLERCKENVNIQIDFYKEEEPEENLIAKCQKLLTKMLAK